MPLFCWPVEMQNKYTKYSQVPFLLIHNMLRMIRLSVMRICPETSIAHLFGKFYFLKKSSCLPPAMRSQYILMHNASKPSVADIPKSESQDPIGFIYRGCFKQMISVRMWLLMMMAR